MKRKISCLTTAAVVLLLALTAGCSSLQGLGNGHASTHSADGNTITYSVRGQGNPTIVFIHCWTCNHEFWKPQIEHFSKDHQVVWLDLAGHGLSSSNRQDYTILAFGEDVAAVVNKIEAENLILVGHSMGGPVAIEAANLLGDKVIGIVGVDTFYTSFKYPETEAEIEGFVKPFKADFHGASEQMVRSMFTPDADPELMESIVDQFSRADKEMGVSAMYELFRWNAESAPSSLDKHSKRLRNINAAPTGKESALHESVVMMPGVGHFVAQVKPDEFNATLSEIISGFQR